MYRIYKDECAMCMLPVCAESLSHVWLFATPWTVAQQAPLSMGFSRQEYWSGLPCPPPGGLPNQGIQPRSPLLQLDSLPSEPPGNPMNTRVGSLSLLQRVVCVCVHTYTAVCFSICSYLHSNSFQSNLLIKSGSFKQNYITWTLFFFPQKSI